MIPAKIVVDGAELPASAFKFTIASMPSFEPWRVLRGTVAIPGGVLYLQVFGRKDFGLPHTIVPETILLANVTDRIVHVSATMPGVGFSGGLDERVLSPYSGAGFSNDDAHVMPVGVPVVASNKFDPQFAKSAANPDVKVTRYTGSAGIDFFQPEAWWIDAGGGISPAAFKFFEANRLFNDRRAIWWIHSNPDSQFVGMPVALFDKDAKLDGFSEWEENAEGLNPYDVHHIDFDEVGEGALRFEHPRVLLAIARALVSRARERVVLADRSEELVRWSDADLRRDHGRNVLPRARALSANRAMRAWSRRRIPRDAFGSARVRSMARSELPREVPDREPVVSRVRIAGGACRREARLLPGLAVRPCGVRLAALDRCAPSCALGSRDAVPASARRSRDSCARRNDRVHRRRVRTPRALLPALGGRHDQVAR